MTAENQIRALHAGVCGADIPVERFEFGAGIVLRKTYAHIMAPYLAAFHPAAPGKPHPAPWKAVSGGLGFDVSLELSVPPDVDPPKPFDHVGVLWFLISILRLRASPMLRVPVIASHPFSDIAGLPFEPRFWPIEMESQHFCPVSDPPGVLAKADLDWTKQFWRAAAKLYASSDEFETGFVAADRVVWSSSMALALVSLWGALERLFTREKTELRFRVSANIAAYLEPSGVARVALFRVVRGLYDKRSEAAHGSADGAAESVTQTYNLLRRALFRMIEEERVPSRDDLEACLFGAYGSA